MAQFLVTVKFPKNPDHDPSNKKIGPCPANPDMMCTDVTGQHHTVLWKCESILQAVLHWEDAKGMHVTRVEEV